MKFVKEETRTVVDKTEVQIKEEEIKYIRFMIEYDFTDIYLMKRSRSFQIRNIVKDDNNCINLIKKGFIRFWCEDATFLINLKNIDPKSIVYNNGYKADWYYLKFTDGSEMRHYVSCTYKPEELLAARRILFKNYSYEPEELAKTAQRVIRQFDLTSNEKMFSK